MMPFDNLWPEDMDTPQEETPGLILRRQADGLKERTRNLVEGEVKTVTSDGRLIHRFYARAPLLDYRILLFDVRHGIEPYPASVVWPQGALNPRDAVDPESFLDIVREIFGHPKTRRTIRQLQAYARAQGLPFLLVEGGEIVGEAKTLARALQKSREIVSHDSEVTIHQNGVEVASVRNVGGNVTEHQAERVSAK